MSEPEAPCSVCDGSGGDSEANLICTACAGTGKALPAAVPEPPRAHVFVPAGRFAPAGSGAGWRYCNICGLVERADGTNKPCSGQCPPLSLRETDKVPEPDAAFEVWFRALETRQGHCQSYERIAFLAGYAAAQSAQRDALAGLLEQWGHLAAHMKSEHEVDTAWTLEQCVAELRALLEGKPSE